MHEHIAGIVPPMTTPFRSDDTIDEAALRADTRYLIETARVHGLAVTGSTGEGHALTTDEVRRITAVVSEEVRGRVPVITGIITDSTASAVARGLAVKDLGVAALQVTPVHYLFRPDDDAMVRHFDVLATRTGLPIIIYNVVPWTYLSPQLLARIIRSVPGVIGVKQSAGDMKLLADLLLLVGDDARIMTAVDALLYPSFALGAHGAIAAILTAAPESLRAALGRGAGGRPQAGTRASRKAPAAVERDLPRQSSRQREVLPGSHGTTGGCAARADARDIAGPGVCDPGGAPRRGSAPLTTDRQPRRAARREPRRSGVTTDLPPVKEDADHGRFRGHTRSRDHTAGHPPRLRRECGRRCRSSAAASRASSPRAARRPSPRAPSCTGCAGSTSSPSPTSS